MDSVCKNMHSIFYLKVIKASRSMEWAVSHHNTLSGNHSHSQWVINGIHKAGNGPSTVYIIDKL